MKIEKVAISSLVFDPANARKHGAKNMEAIKGSLARFGQQKPIVVDDKGVVLAGNGTLAAAKELGWTEIDVHRTSLTGTDKTAFAIADNRTGELAEWDIDNLGTILKDLDADILKDIGFDAKDLEKLLPETIKEGLCDEDEVPEVKDTRCKPGDLWQLGNHRLLCGDSTNVQHVERLMGGGKADLWLTDPPYGVAYESAGRRGKSNQHAEIANDAMPLDEMSDFWSSVAANALISTSDEAPYYWFACQGGDQMMMMMMSISRAGWKVRHELIWVKDQMVFGRSDYHYKHEPILYGWKQDGTHGWYSDRKQTSVLEFPRPKKSEEHPTMKPVELVQYLISNSCKQKGSVLDTFCGSGTTLIACEKTHRKGFGIELSPHYCDVILARWEKFTGQKAALLDH